MASGMTNRGRKRMNLGFWRRETLPAQYYVALCTAATTPTFATNKLSDLVEIAAGNGYTAGGIAVPASAVGFDLVTEDDVNNRSDIRLADVEWNATGALPSAGAPLRWAVLLDDDVAPANRDVFLWFDLGGEFTRGNGESIILAGFKIRVKLPAA